MRDVDKNPLRLHTKNASKCTVNKIQRGHIFSFTSSIPISAHHFLGITNTVKCYSGTTWHSGTALMQPSVINRLQREGGERVRERERTELKTKADSVIISRANVVDV